MRENFCQRRSISWPKMLMHLLLPQKRLVFTIPTTKIVLYFAINSQIVPKFSITQTRPDLQLRIIS